MQVSSSSSSVDVEFYTSLPNFHTIKSVEISWLKKVKKVVPAVVVSEPVVSEIVYAPNAFPDTEVVQTVEIPTVDDKISTIEHKNGEQMVDSREEDNEVRGG